MRSAAFLLIFLLAAIVTAILAGRHSIGPGPSVSQGLIVFCALAGVALVRNGVRRDRFAARVSGILLQLAAGPVFALSVTQHVWRPVDGLPILNGQYLTCLVVSLAGLSSAYCASLRGERLRPVEFPIVSLLGAWGALWWFAGGIGEIDRRVYLTFKTGAVTVFVSASCILFDCARKRFEWMFLRLPALAILPAMFFCAFLSSRFGRHPFASGGFIGWPIAFATLYLILYRNEDMREDVLSLFHAGALWLIAVLVPWELAWQAGDRMAGGGSWDVFAAGMSLCAIILPTCLHGHKLAWPIGKRPRAYIFTGLGPIALSAWFWALGMSFLNEGNPWPLTYLPLINPLELSTGVVIFSAAVYFLRLRSSRIVLPEYLKVVPFSLLFGASVFVWLNTVLVRSVHYWGGVPFSSTLMFRSNLLQTSFSIFWGLTALGIMFFSARRKLRSLWITGAALLGLVVLKLFLTDLFGKGPVESIVSYIVIGVAILMVTYHAPFPSQEEGESTKK